MDDARAEGSRHLFWVGSDHKSSVFLELSVAVREGERGKSHE